MVYEYDNAIEEPSYGQLLSVRSPIVNSTGGLNNFPNGKSHKYTYLNHADPKLKNALKSVVFPNQNAAGSELTRCEWSYRINGVKDPFFGYVEKYSLGNPTATASLAAGGTFTYAYKTSGEIKSDPNEPAWEIAVTDRRGTKTTYRVNRLGQVLFEAISNTGLRPNDNLPPLDDGLPFPYEPDLPDKFTKSFKYNSDGQLTNRFNPLGEKTDYIYGNRRDLEYNKNRKIPRNSEFNLTSTVRFPDSERPAGQKQIKEMVVYEPIFNQPFKKFNPRGFDNRREKLTRETDDALRQRFTTTFFYDYMEALGAAKTDFASLLGLTAAELQSLFNEAGITDLVSDVNGDTLRNQFKGNVIRIAYPTVLRPKSVIAEIFTQLGLSGEVERAEELFRYNQYGQVVYHRDAEENVTVTTYYDAADPNGTSNQNGSETGGGYLRSIIRDAEALAGRNSGYKPDGQNPAQALMQTNRFEYTAQGEGFPANPRGVPTAVIDPRGIKSKYLVNELDQVIKTVNAASVPASAGLTAFAYESITLYDHNDNVVETRVQNEDTLIDNDIDFVVNTYSYDILDQKTSETLDATGPNKLGIKNTFDYDPNQNLIRYIRGASKLANAPDHATDESAYDERDILLTTTFGVEEGDKKAIFKNDVNAEGDITKIIDAEDADVTAEMSAGQKTAVDAADGALGGDPTYIKYDGFGRAIERIDRAGNRTVYEYDSVSNIRSIQSFGPVDEASGKILLAKEETQYDERNRPYRTDRYIFHYKGKEVGTIDDGALDKGDGKVSSITLYDRLGRVVGEIDANNNAYITRYDGLSRVVATVDPLNNEVHNTYDLNGNLVQVREVEKSPLIASDEIFISNNRYDALNRLTAFVEPNDQTTTYQYDSRNNQIKITDQLGNQTEKHYDHLNRLVETRSYLSSNGVSASAANKDTSQSDDGVITLKQEWDDLNRLVAQIDDRTNRTVYVYDDLNRKVRTTYANGTFETWRYSRDSELQESVDQNGTRVTYDYDAESRRTKLEVLLSPSLGGLGGTTLKTWSYDGLNRITLSTDNNGDSTEDDVICTYVYDSLSRKIRETQKIGTLPELAIDTDWQGEDREVSVTYPNGRKVKRSYDALNRLFEIREATGDSLISRFEYVGPDRDVRVTYGKDAAVVMDKRNSVGTQTISGTNPGYDANRRNVRHEWKKGPETIVAYVNTYNGPNGIGTDRRASEKREHLASHTDSYTFDSKYRMIGFRRNGTGVGVGGTLSQRTLSGADKTATLAEGTKSTTIDLGANDEYAKMNQYKAFAGKPRSYDRNSSLDSDGHFKYIRDYSNRIVEIRGASDSVAVGNYTYDANNRRVLRVIGNKKTRYIYDGWEVVEERGNNNAILRQYVDGRDVDEHLQLKDGATGEVYYYYSNSQGSIGALTDEAGEAVEFYEYSWLGKPIILNAANISQTLSSSKVGNSYFFQGRQLDAETAVQISDELDSPGLYYYRNRYYSPVTGEFLTVDPLGYWNHEQGNGFSAFCEDGWNFADPYGEVAPKKPKRKVISGKDWDDEHNITVTPAGADVKTAANVKVVAEAKRKKAKKNDPPKKNRGRLEAQWANGRPIRIVSLRTPEDVDRGTEVTTSMRKFFNTENSSDDVGHMGGGAKLGTPAHRPEWCVAQDATTNRGEYSNRTERQMRRWVKSGDYAYSVTDFFYHHGQKRPYQYRVTWQCINPVTLAPYSVSTSVIPVSGSHTYTQ